jgi:hypothetical protein
MIPPPGSVGALGRPSRFHLLSGEVPDALISRLQPLPEQEARGWLGRIEGLGELLDAQWEVRAEPQFLSEHDDELHAIERGYGDAKRPEDYLEGFSAFVRDPGNDANQTKAITIVDREELDDDLLYFKRGGAAGRG